ncbi:MAG: GNAT family N-acetyltransferase [Gammaproteobacteria bacterium]|nr:GNAT family N-acetyltransferase [Gammaproteobacteria bacterium]
MLSTRLAGPGLLRGRRVSLAPVAPEHAAFLYQCYQDSAFMDLYRLAQSRKETEAQITVRLEEEQKRPPQQIRRFEWVISRHAKEGGPGEPIGLASVADYQRNFRRGEFLIGIRGAKPAGIGLEASLLVLDFAFNQQQLHKFVSFVYGHNQISQDNTLQLGFTQEGLLHDHLYYKHTGFVDLYQNALLEDDFRTNKRLARLSKRLLGWDITQKPSEPKVLPKEQLQKMERLLKQGLAQNRPQQAQTTNQPKAAVQEESPLKNYAFPLNVYVHALFLEGGESLHYGLFNEAGEKISIAQQRATDKLFNWLPPAPLRLLEVGIGLGKTARRLTEEGYVYTGVVPDKQQIAYAAKKYPVLADKLLPAYFERFQSKDSYDLILFQESAQYIQPAILLEKAAELLNDKGQIIIMDEIPLTTFQALAPNARLGNFIVQEMEELTQAAAPSVTHLYQAIEKHKQTILAELNVPLSKLEQLLGSLTTRAAQYAEGKYFYALLRLTRN